MKKILVFFSLLLWLSSCSHCNQTEKHKKDQREIQNMLEHYFIAIENEDFQMIENAWKHSDSIVLLGTNSREMLIGWVSIRKAFGQQFALVTDTYISISQQYIRIGSSGTTAWFSQLMNYNFIADGLAQSHKGLRFTGVLEKCEHGWKLVQGHLSAPVEIQLKQR